MKRVQLNIVLKDEVESSLKQLSKQWGLSLCNLVNFIIFFWLSKNSAFNISPQRLDEFPITKVTRDKVVEYYKRKEGIKRVGNLRPWITEEIMNILREKFFKGYLYSDTKIVLTIIIDWLIENGYIF